MQDTQQVLGAGVGDSFCIDARFTTACVTLVRALVYCNFLREVRLGGWGNRGPKGPT